ncbi:MAG: sigma-70 family RNA polymerase sigma factor [Actinobacteria bacterium]|nr:sigma-70 family RNA polymerase sigma factor [Actinomycetota bacterium]MBI3688806.1 sigma-70 family RNA polymerase sigma factor [Actinomycetota bacterium]
MMVRLHDDHAAVLYAFVQRYVPDQQRAQDVVQETLLRAWRNLDGIDLAGGSPRSYLFTIARNVLTDTWRAEQRRPRLVRDDEALARVPAPDEVEAAIEGWLVTEALDRLSPEHRGVIHALYYDGRTVAEVAEAMEIPAGTVKSRSYYAVRALRVILEEMGVMR